MKKRFILTLLLCLIPNIIKAESVKVQIDAPSTVYIGDNVKVNVTLSSKASLGSWQYTIGYDDSKLGFISSTSGASQSAGDSAASGGQTSITYTWQLKANKEGNATFNIPTIAVYAFDDESKMEVTGTTSKTIVIKKPAPISNGNSNQTTYKYSSNNNLSSLTIEGFEINFDKNETNYNITVPNDTKKIKIGATAEDGKSRVSGIGEFEVKEGINNLNVVVKAENGNTKTYTINVDVLELSPIEVKIEDKNYFVIRKQELLPLASIPYVPSKILIKGEEVPCYYNEKSNIYLVGLKDENGNISLYSYDNLNDKYQNYQELSFGNIYIQILEPENILKNYKKDKIKINDIEITSYIKEKNFPLIYGKNIETGEISYYTYDKNENTIQRYIDNNNENNEYYPFIIIILMVFMIIQFIIMNSIIISKNKKLKKILSDKLSTKTKYEEKLEKKKKETNDDMYKF